MARPLLEVCGDVRRGEVVNEAAVAFQELNQRVREVGKKGKIVLTIEVEPDKNDDGAYSLNIDYTVSMPKKKRAKGIFFMNPDGSLTRNDPRQIDAFPDAENVRTIGERALAQVGRGPVTE